MNDAVIIAVANAITANAEVLKSLIESLPKETKAKVEKQVNKATPVAEEKPVAAPATPAVVETTTQAVVAPTTPAMPAAPFPTVAAAAPTPPVIPPAASPALIPPSQPVGAATAAVPFNDHKTMLKYVMDSYQSMPKEKGAMIQQVLASIGVQNINDVKPEQYGALFAGVEALKQ